jgi:phenylalanyl-tRNA synthetase alpha chain
MINMKNKLENIKKDFLKSLEEVKNIDALEKLEFKYFSRKGELSSLLRSLKDLDLEAKKEIGKLANSLKNELKELLDKTKHKFKGSQLTNLIDPTLKGEELKVGSLHPITILRREIEDFFATLGFMSIDGPELESDYYNFTALNVLPHHPARDMQDTFYIDSKNKDNQYDLLMRTQTSNTQVRAMLKYGAPLRAIVPGRCFRCESTDARHEHTFYQLEGIMIDENINLAHLKAVLEETGRFLYGPETKLRTRPKYFPFVEPGLNGEFSCFLCQGKGCRVCKNSGWLEVLGCGLIHPHVLKAGGIDPEKYSGFAFGFGLDRLVMLKYDIKDIRLFHSGDLRFLKQF